MASNRPSPKDRAARSEEQVLYELLRNGRSSASAIAFQIFVGSDLDLVPIESMVLVEARILCGDYSVLEIDRDLAERNEFVPFSRRRVVNPGLQAALDVHRGCRWVDPPGGHKDQRGEQPKKHHADDNPPNKGWEEAPPKRGFGLRVWRFSHVSESYSGLGCRSWMILCARTQRCSILLRPPRDACPFLDLTNLHVKIDRAATVGYSG